MTDKKMYKSDIHKLVDTVIEGGYCIGCGACTYEDTSPIRIEFDEYKKLQASVDIEFIDDNNTTEVLSVCPFTDESLDEDQLGGELFATNCIKDDKLGYVDSTYAGYVIEDGFRDNGSSGGMGTWILQELMNKKLIDAVIHVKENSSKKNGDKLFEYGISNNEKEVFDGAKSRYYPIEMSKVLQLIKSKPGKYAIVGLPCFIKSIRLICKKDKILNERIKFCIGLVCGHLKSAHFASMWAWQAGIHPENLKSINFREKIPGEKAINYGIKATGIVDGNIKTLKSRPLNELYGKDWGWGYFKYKACDYCDDVVAETADLTIGDAWLPEYMQDSKGTNLIITRNKTLSDLVSKAEDEGRLYLDEISKENAVKSQSSGFKHRRQGLAYRLSLADQNNIWRPNKRVKADINSMSLRYKKIMDLRMALAVKSHKVFLKALSNNSFNDFIEEMKPLVKKYNKAYQVTFMKRVKIKLYKILGIN